MGCWNETCAISKMAIRAGEAVRFLPIVQNPYHIEEIKGFPLGEGEAPPLLLKGSSGCYIGDLWMPLCYPIRGEYNDHGTIENIPDKTNPDGAEIDQFVAAFKKYCVPLELGENKYHDNAIKNFTLDEILGALQEGRCFMDYHSGLPQYEDRIVPIAWMMIKESVWQSLLNTNIKKSGEVWERKGEPDQYSVKGIRDGLSEMVDSYMKPERQNELMKKSEDKTITAEEVKELLDNLSKRLDASERYVQRWVWHMSPIDAPKLNNYILDVAAEMEYVHKMLGILRINYAPTTGSGSQCDNYKLWKLVNKSWLKIIAADLKERAAETKKWNAEYKVILAKEKEKKEQDKKA